MLKYTRKKLFNADSFAQCKTRQGCHISKKLVSKHDTDNIFIEC